MCHSLEFPFKTVNCVLFSQLLLHFHTNQLFSGKFMTELPPSPKPITHFHIQTMMRYSVNQHSKSSTVTIQILLALANRVILQLRGPSMHCLNKEGVPPRGILLFVLYCRVSNCVHLMHWTLVWRPLYCTVHALITIQSNFLIML